MSKGVPRKSPKSQSVGPREIADLSLDDADDVAVKPFPQIVFKENLKPSPKCEAANDMKPNISTDKQTKTTTPQTNLGADISILKNNADATIKTVPNGDHNKLEMTLDANSKSDAFSNDVDTLKSSSDVRQMAATSRQNVATSQVDVKGRPCGALLDRLEAVPGVEEGTPPRLEGRTSKQLEENTSSELQERPLLVSEARTLGSEENTSPGLKDRTSPETETGTSSGVEKRISSEFEPRTSTEVEAKTLSAVEPKTASCIFEQPVSLSQILTQRAKTEDAVEDARREAFHKDGHAVNVDGGKGAKEYHSQQPGWLLTSFNRLPESMGNGASTKSSKVSQSPPPSEVAAVVRDKIPEDYEYLKGLIPQLKKDVKDCEEKAAFWETQSLELRRLLKLKDSEVLKLQREVHKLKSVLQQATSFAKDGDLLSSLQDQHGMASQQPKQKQILPHPAGLKKQGVSGESSEAGQLAEDILIQRYDKDFRSKQLIKDAIMDNDFLKNLDSSQVRELVESMYPTTYTAGSYVINEGEAGSHLYVAAEGEFEVIKEKKVLGRMGPGKAFGELAILYNCTRTASIRVVKDSQVWVLDRRVFQQIMMRTGLQRLEDNINFLMSVPLLRDLSQDVLAKIADVLEVEFYPANAYIIRQGAHGDTFFIISGGSVKVTQKIPGRREEEEIRTLQRGDYFGEQALINEECRTASIIALHPGVECLTLDRDSFRQLIGDLQELRVKDYGDETRGLSRPSSSFSISDTEQEFDQFGLDELDVIATLGVGGFGRVELVQWSFDKTQTFALKCLKKKHIVDTQQQEHVFSEKAIMLGCRSPFICRLYRTFKDTKYVYMLLEACLGGEVWTILRDKGHFDDSTTRFVTGCVVEAFSYLHARGIVYRDLKPENLLLDAQGYVKLVDFGFSKRLGYSSKTWTFCGTPEYVAPEVILNKGHDRAVDYWSLGVLMHELLTGTPPFVAADPMRTYNVILKGIDLIDFPRHITRSAQSLIKRLCRDAPSERLGYQRGGIDDIKKHKWFQGFDWDGLKQRSLAVPITPQVKGPTDTGNFDVYPKDNDPAPEEFSNWDAEF